MLRVPSILLVPTLVFGCVAWGCGIVPRDGQFTCDDGLCPAGFSCGLDRLCHLGGFDGGLDGGERLDAPGPDAPTDAPAGMESCTPGPAGRGEDEDVDGVIDEGCLMFFGTVHPVLRAMPVTTRDPMGAPILQYFGAELSADGRTLFTTAADGIPREFLIASRMSPRAEFSTAVPATGSMLPGHAPALVTVTGDAAEVFLQMTSVDASPSGHIFTSGLVSGTWSTPVEVTELSGAGETQVQPHVSRDGLELYFVARPRAGGTGVIQVARRTDRSLPWGPPVALGDGLFPSLSADELSLIFMDGPVTRTIVVVTRASRADDFGIGGAVPFAPTIPNPGAVMARPFFSPTTREVFFSLLTNTSGVVPPDGPLTASVFRAEVCRDGACPARTLSCTGVPSPDGLHCYRSTGLSTTYADAPSRCDGDEHLVSAHSMTEATFITDRWLNSWLGAMGYAWQSGEPFLYDRFTVEPTAAQCVRTDWALADCVTPPRTVICERDLWPTFSD